jgi:hypothetical protein
MVGLRERATAHFFRFTVEQKSSAATSRKQQVIDVGSTVETKLLSDTPTVDVQDSMTEFQKIFAGALQQQQQ